MRLSEALRINEQAVSATSPPRKIHLVCGFTPLHLETFVKANVRLNFPTEGVEIISGLFGDLEGNVRKATQTQAEGALVVLEWTDLDERLGLRSSAGWGSEILADVLQQVPEKLRRLETGLADLAKKMPVAVLAATLPIPPLTHLPPLRASGFELQLQCAKMHFLCRICSLPGVRLVSDTALALHSPHAQRQDVKMELHAGFPYTTAHASAAAELMVSCLFPPVPKKGLITDLDDTLWKGILGDVGVGALSWCLEDRSQAHAIYQQLVASLAESGVLVGVASKNDPDLVREAFVQPNLLLREAQVFPMEANWGAKSESVGRILRAWNIGADSVVYVDDSPMELAEVAEKHPGIECLRFPTEDPAGIVELVYRLRSLFGKNEVRDEDRLRLESLRSSAAIEAAQSTGAAPDFLARLNAKIVLRFSTSANDGRAFELVNKTNQFNLNGRRYTESEWRSYFERPDVFLVTAEYEDRFGPLGKIAVMGGYGAPGGLQVDIWVMSCRAFSRHIEFQMLRRLYEKYRASRIRFSFKPTERNGPIQEFFGRFVKTELAENGLELSASTFEQGRPELFHNVTETIDG
jgi:FkbH-like protein